MSFFLALLTVLAHIALLPLLILALAVIVLLIVDCWVGDSARIARARRRAGGT